MGKLKSSKVWLIFQIKKILDRIYFQKQEFSFKNIFYLTYLFTDPLVYEKDLIGSFKHSKKDEPTRNYGKSILI